MGFTSSVMLNPELESLCLGDHAVVDVLLQIVRQSRYRCHQIVALILRIVLIVMIHRRAMVVELIAWDIAPQCLVDRGGMHPKFTDKATPISSIMQKGHSLGALVHARFLTKVPR